MTDASKALTASAEDSSRDVKEHARDSDVEEHGFDWTMVLIILLVAFLFGIIIMFLA